MLKDMGCALLGVLAGVVTGVIPGLHVNTISFFILLSSTTNTGLIFFTIGMLVSHNFFDFLPSIFLSAPEEATSLSVSVGKKWLLKGKGWEAIKIANLGGLCSLLISVLLSPLLLLFIPFLYNNFSYLTGVILAGVSLHLLLKEKNFWKAVTVFVMAGTLGFITLRTHLLPHPLMALLTGLFGMSSLLESLKEKTVIPKQIRVYGNELTKKELMTGSLKGSLSSILLGFIPAIGPSQASLLVDDTRKSDEELLVGLGGVNTSDIILSLIALFTIGKARSGALKVLQDKFVFENIFFFYLMIACFVSAIASFILIKLIGPWFVKFFEKMNYQKLCSAMLVFLCILILAFNGWEGLIVSITGALIGFYAKGVRKSQLMSALMVPTLFYFFF
ncbi:MAG: hypothetical protein GOU97_00090 [Nanoarchaeota archaeon]|nr:hypothetical protein [Nanoarchaeota archaeon]